MNMIVSAAAVAAATPAMALAPDVNEDDPTFAAIERYRTAFAAFLARCDLEEAIGGPELQPAPGDYRTPELVAAVDESRASRLALANCVSTTPEGLIALLAFVRENSVSNSTDPDEELDRDNFFDGDEEQLAHARSVEIAVRGMTGELRPWQAVQPARPSAADDPIFAAIEAHRAAHEARESAFDAYKDLSESSPEHALLTNLPKAQIDIEDGGVPVLARAKPDIWRHASKFADDNERQAFVVKAEKLLAAAKRKRSRAAKRAGLTDAWNAFERHAAEARSALETLAAIKPRSQAGAVAAVAHATTLLEDDRVEFDEFSPELIAILRNAAPRDLPTPVGLAA